MLKRVRAVENADSKKERGNRYEAKYVLAHSQQQQVTFQEPQQKLVESCSDPFPELVDSVTNQSTSVTNTSCNTAQL